MRFDRLWVTSLLFWTTWAGAGTSAPSSAVTVSADGTRLLVMLYPDRSVDQAAPVTLPDGRTVVIRDTFAKSGAYDASTLEPAWQVGWFSRQDDLLWSDDFQHVVRVNRQAFVQGWALAFYDRGHFVRQYDCGELLTHLSMMECLPFGTWDWHTRWYGPGIDLSADHRSLSVATARRGMFCDGRYLDLGWQEFYTFDLANGALTSRRTSGTGRLIALATAGTGAIIAITFTPRLLWRAGQLLLRRQRRRRRGFPVLLRTTA